MDLSVLAKGEKKLKDNELRELLTKKPFTRVKPDGHYNHGERFGNVMEETETSDFLHRKIVTQEDFLRELDPYGHLINDREYYPDIYRRNPEDGKWYLEEVPRYAFAFQSVILYKHLTHLTGNDIQFELADKKDDVDARHIYNAFKRGWQERNMETAWYQLAKSVKATGDGAFVGFMNGKKFAWKVLSFLKGDKLFPHYDIKTGELNLLARTYCNFDETGKVVNRFVDVWDKEFYYCLKSSGDATTAVEKFKQATLSLFNMSGYSLIQKEPHGFEQIPVAYQRNDMGACWTLSQESIDNYEMAFSRMAQSNHDFGLPIMYVKGEGSEEVATQDMSHASKIFFLPSDGEMGFLNRQDASNGYEKELSVLEKQIYTQSFAVTPPELKSGDLPAAALKILYSPAYEKAMSDANEFDGAVDKMVEIFSHGYGVETGKQLKFKSTPIAHYIKPYVHLNETELTTNLSMQVQNGFLSKQTASEKSVYATPQEWDRILAEKKSEQENDLLFDEKKIIIEKKQKDEPVDNGDMTPHGDGKFVWDKNRNKVDPVTGKAYSKWDNYKIQN
ncbi:phage portal protein [Hoylesella buccalis]|uniref:phage portal protein n=1 Tax=Hoylesella buccalis TaxID=28127 RepID=UPI001D147691|nr:phage portal protein [Hoylesella buccalis]UEA63044.1 phage portal protein [Hoylesella buccalis]UWP49666.1 phage portal protein [Hoylesella buccalis ATCC 35310]